jgi:hypothetical protein
MVGRFSRKYVLYTIVFNFILMCRVKIKELLLAHGTHMLVVELARQKINDFVIVGECKVLATVI